MIRYNQLRERRESRTGWRSAPFRVADVLFRNNPNTAAGLSDEVGRARGFDVREQMIERILDAYLNHVSLVESEEALLQLRVAIEDRLRYGSRPRDRVNDAPFVHDPMTPRFRFGGNGQAERIYGGPSYSPGELARLNEQFVNQAVDAPGALAARREAIGQTPPVQAPPETSEHTEWVNVRDEQAPQTPAEDHP